LIAGNFHPLNLCEREVTDLVEFLENGLYDSHLSRYKPDFTMSGNCFPDNDLESQIDLGCK
jgi:cytochrome c peroxidase